MVQVEFSVRAFARSSAIVAGLLLLGIGLVDVVIGHAKIAQYETVVAQEVSLRPPDPATLFPKVTEAEEPRAVAQAKLGFYNVLVLAGQVMTLGGLIVLVIGVVLLRRRALDAMVVTHSR